MNPRWHIWQLKYYQLCSNTGLSVTISAEHATSASLHNFRVKSSWLFVMLRSASYLEIFVLVAIIPTELPHICRMTSHSASETVIWKEWLVYASCVYTCWNNRENFREQEFKLFIYMQRLTYLKSSWGSPANSRTPQVLLLIKYHCNISY